MAVKCPAVAIARQILDGFDEIIESNFVKLPI